MTGGGWSTHSTRARTVIRPSRQQYRLGIAQRRKRRATLLIGLLPVATGYAAGAFVLSHGNLVIVFAPLAAMIPLGIVFFMLDVLYLTAIRLEFTPGLLERQGFPFPRRHAYIPRLRAIVSRNVDFGVGIVGRAWFLVNSDGLCPCWLYADVWDPADMRRLAESLGGQLQESSRPPLSRPAIATEFPGPAQRW
jgi:hypothetical protein